jgi:hypothetical protein
LLVLEVGLLVLLFQRFKAVLQVVNHLFELGVFSGVFSEFSDLFLHRSNLLFFLFNPLLDLLLHPPAVG